MGRVAFSWNDWTEKWDGTPFAVGGLTADDAGNPTPTERQPLRQGGPVSRLSGGSGKASFYTVVPWQLYANGLVQLPMGFDASAAFIARAGGAYPVSLLLSGGSDGTNAALATDQVDSLTYDSIYNLDLRLAKTIRLGGSSLVLSGEWFNVLNTDFVLSRYRYANQAPFTAATQGAEAGLGRIEEIIMPSIIRFGATFSF
jgi:hypothetical protein